MGVRVRVRLYVCYTVIFVNCFICYISKNTTKNSNKTSVSVLLHERANRPRNGPLDLKSTCIRYPQSEVKKASAKSRV